MSKPYAGSLSVAAKPYAALSSTNLSAYAFRPSDIAGLMSWHRADLGVTIGTGVSAWADQSGTGDANKNMAQATGSKQPTLNASDAAYNNQATLSFVGASAQYLKSAAWAASLAAPYTIFVVGNDDGTATAQQYFCDASGNTVQIWQGGVALVYRAYAGTIINGTTAPTSGKRVLIFVANGASSALYNSAQTPEVTANAGTDALTGTQVGIWSDFTSNPLNGKIAELAVYNSALASSDINKLLTYANNRYAITIGA